MATDKQWMKHKILGAGTYGTVYLAAPVDSSFFCSSLMAAKSAILLNSSVLKREALFLYHLRGCPEVVRCFGEDISLENNRKVYSLFLEYAPHGTLDDLIKFFGKIPESLVAFYAYTLLKGLSYIHGKGIVHCDIKPCNILIFPSAYGDKLGQLKLANFGMAKFIEEKEIFSLGQCTYNQEAPLYAPPESIVFDIHETSTDIWSFGCTVAEMLIGKPLWENKNVLFDELEIPEYVSETCKDFLKRCLARDCEDRWSAKMLLSHEFITQNVGRITSRQIYFELLHYDLLSDLLGLKEWTLTRNLFLTPSVAPPCVTKSQTNERRTEKYYTLFSGVTNSENPAS